MSELGAAIFAGIGDGQLSIDDRVYPRRLPQGATLPALTWQLVSQTGMQSHSDAQDHPTYTGAHYHKERVQFNAYGDTEDDAELLAAELERYISGFRGSWGEQTVSVSTAELALDDFDVDVQKWRRITDYFISWTQAADGS